MIDLTIIRAAAEAATPGPWRQIKGVLYDKDFDEVCAAGYGIGLGQADTRYGSNCKRKANGEFLKQIDPAAVLELLDRLEAAEKDAQLVRNEVLEEAAKSAEDVSQIALALLNVTSQPKAIAAHIRRMKS